MTYTPQLGGALPQGFPAQFRQTKFDAASFATTPIELLALDGSGTVLSHGTGFFWRSDAKVYLITARHVLSGLNPFTNDPMQEATGFIPRECIVRPTIRLDSSIKRVEFQALLTDELGNPFWREDPEFATLRTDITALLVPDPPEGQIVCLNEALSAEEVVTFVGVDCSILGYPNLNYGGLLTPLWRRATIASEPATAVDGKPMFLVDASTAPGFSGGPVLRRQYGSLAYHGDNGELSIDVGRILTTNLVGVYAGRLQNRYIGGEVPFVFYANRIPNIIGNPRGVALRFKGVGNLTEG